MLKKLFLRYFAVGASAYLIEMLSLFILLKAFKVSPVVAVGISFWIGFVVAFVMQKFITFGNDNKQKRVVMRQIFLYSVLVTVNYLFTLFMVGLLSSKISVFCIRTGVIAIVTTWNFFVYRLIFSDANESKVNASAS